MICLLVFTSGKHSDKIQEDLPRLFRNMRSTTEEYKPSWSPSSFSRKSYKLSLSILLVIWSGCFIDFRHIQRQRAVFFRLKIVLLWKKICKYKPISCTSVTSPPLGPFNIQAANCINYHSKTSVRQELLSCSLMQVTIFNSSTQQPPYISTHKHGARVFPKKRTWNLIWGVAEFSCVITFHIISMTFLPTWKSPLLGKYATWKIIKAHKVQSSGTGHRPDVFPSPDAIDLNLWDHQLDLGNLQPKITKKYMAKWRIEWKLYIMCFTVNTCYTSQ